MAQDPDTQAVRPEIQAVRLQGPVRITMPAAVAYDLKALQKGIATLVERLGCQTCFSGADCVFQLERDLLINEKLEISPSARVFSPDPDGDPARLGRGVTVNLAPEVRFNLDRIQVAIERIVDRLGHPQCCSGFDIAFRQELDFITVDKDLDVKAFGKSF